MADNDKIVTKESLRKFYNQIQPYLNGGAHTGYTPVGTVISIMGNDAPQHYLKCDGSIYNIVDYEELANYFNEQFGSKNYFGGNGTTTFAVPDLQGEFLRGTGTNSHENGGIATAVGTHQTPTLGNVTLANVSSKVIQARGVADGGNNVAPLNMDTTIKASELTNPKYISAPAGSTGAASATTNIYYTMRPTNTAVLFCIATKNIYVDARYDYSTYEKVVGTWVDGKPLYQKTFSYSVGTQTTKVTIPVGTVSNVDYIVSCTGICKRGNNLQYEQIPMYDNSEWFVYTSVTMNDTTATINIVENGRSNATGYVTLQYTKTTD